MDLISIGNGEVSVSVSPLGAEMQRLTTADGREWLWDGDPAFWTGRSPILFPMVGRAPNDTVTIEGRRFQMAQHGFARRSAFTLIERSEDRCRFELAASEASRGMYPFDFTLAVEHRVEGRAVAVAAEIRNLDRRPMPFGIGFHPAFRWPLPGAEGAAHRVMLDNGGAPALRRLEGGLVRREALPSPFKDGALMLSPELFEHDALLFPQGAGSGVRYTGGDTAIHFTWENLVNFALWSKPGAGFVCLEPWHGTAAEVGGSDDLAERPYGVVLEPGGSRRFGFRAELIG